VKQEKISQKSPLSIPDEWKERFLIKRIKEDNIEISLEERNAILEELNRGRQFVQIGKYTLMLNSIKSIDPLWGADNIPPEPRPHKEGGYFDKEKQVFVKGEETEESIKRRKLWHQLFGGKFLSEKL